MNDFITLANVTSAIRWVMTALGSMAFITNHTDPTSWEAITGGAVALVAFVWSFFVHSDATPAVKV